MCLAIRQEDRNRRKLEREVGRLQRDKANLLGACRGLLNKLDEVAARHNDRSTDYDVCPEVRDAYDAMNKTN